ncbi:uncharacterized protein TRIADDRAFT_56197 [Trichoplax adhaerens]|uniref:Cytochrome P450 n=1 Tax=Trichoplax adhaerens TaxID=10228 RepID=B3RXG2_TRIAD|nr:hypothetical protein TRIADDRAFT_56197 [Trichoplax adhaerens]EDV24416.1 hypothetical protein TRIADDRAFT_56197 [Trichoplax adhaerens]|eukprot:XP_002112306.1 hypothetical protein TRIADDRAFT_56197 [Trichoplax adhaerens]
MIKIFDFLWLPQLSIQSFLFASFLGLITITLYRNFIVPYRKLSKLGINVSPPMPLLGNMLDYGSTNRHIAQVKRQELYGNVCGTLFFHIPNLWVGDPEMLKIITVKEFSNFANRFSLTKPRPPFDKTVVQLKDQDWKRVRTILIPTFSTSKLKGIMPLITDAGDNLIKTMSKAEEEGRAIDMWRTCGVYTMKVILATVFGIDFESKEQEKKLTESAARLFRNTNGVIQFFSIFLTPLFRMVEPLLGGNLVKSTIYLAKTAENVLRERRRNLKNGIPCRRDILQQMIEAGDGDKLTDEEIIAQAFIFLIAGYDTTANTLGFASYSLATNPDVQKKLRDEIDSLCPDANSIDYDTLFSLPYLDMVISETLRMYPPAYFVNREAKEDITINGLLVPKDIMVSFPIYGIHHNPELWPKPNEFIPERFSPEEKAKQIPCSYLPFGGGPRNCVGMRLALLEAKLALVKIIQNFELKTVAETEIPLKLRSGTTLSPFNGAYVGLTRRY